MPPAAHLRDKPTVNSTASSPFPLGFVGGGLGTESQGEWGGVGEKKRDQVALRVLTADTRAYESALKLPHLIDRCRVEAKKRHPIAPRVL